MTGPHILEHTAPLLRKYCFRDSDLTDYASKNTSVTEHTFAEFAMTAPSPAGISNANADAEVSPLCLMDGEFDELVEALLEKHHIPGMSIAIVHGGRIQCKV